MEPIHISNSEVNTFNRCKRKWYYNYYLNRLPMKVATALSTGTAWHDLMETVYDGDYAKFGAANLQLASWQVEGRDDVDLVLLKAMLDGYEDWIDETGEDYKLEFQFVENTGSFEIVQDVFLRGKIDVIVKNTETGEYFLIDHKTAKDWGIIEGLLLNQQMRTYALICREDPELPNVAGALFNIARKVKRTHNAKPPFFQREKIYLNDGMLDNHAVHMREAAVDIKRARDLLDYDQSNHEVCPPNVQLDCSRMCPYFSVCLQHDDPYSDWEWSLETQFKYDDPNARYNT